MTTKTIANKKQITLLVLGRPHDLHYEGGLNRDHFSPQMFLTVVAIFLLHFRPVDHKRHQYHYQNLSGSWFPHFLRALQKHKHGADRWFIIKFSNGLYAIKLTKPLVPFIRRTGLGRLRLSVKSSNIIYSYVTRLLVLLRKYF